MCLFPIFGPKIRAEKYYNRINNTILGCSKENFENYILLKPLLMSRGIIELKEKNCHYLWVPMILVKKKTIFW